MIHRIIISPYTLPIITMSKPMLFGLLDMIEYKYFNPTVYHLHNFPDIVPKMKRNGFAAFISGVKCSWFIYLPLSFLYYFLTSKNSVQLYAMTTYVSFLYLLFMMLSDKIKRKKLANIYYYHQQMYFVLGCAEIFHILSKFFF